MKKQFLAIVLILGLLFGSLYYLFNSSWATSFILPQVISFYFKDTDILEFHVAKQEFVFPKTIILYHIKARLQDNAIPYQLDIKEATIHDITAVISKEHDFKIAWKDLSLLGGKLKVSQANADGIMYLRKDQAAFEGLLKGKRLDFDRIHLKNFSLRLKRTNQSMDILDLRSEACGGYIEGQINLTIHPELNFVIWIEAMKLKAEELKSLNRSFFENVDGVIDGTFRVVGDKGNISLLSINLLMENGSIKKPLLEKIVSRVEDATYKRKIQALIETYPQLSFDRSSLNINRLQNRNVKVSFSLDHKKEGLKVKQIIDFKTGQNITQLLMPN